MSKVLLVPARKGGGAFELVFLAFFPGSVFSKMHKGAVIIYGRKGAVQKFECKEMERGQNFSASL